MSFCFHIFHTDLPIFRIDLSDFLDERKGQEGWFRMDRGIESFVDDEMGIERFVKRD